MAWWQPWYLLTMIVLRRDAVTAWPLPSPLIRISGSVLGITLAAVILGGSPAAIVGALPIGVGWTRWRERGDTSATTWSTFVWFPLLGGLMFHGLAARHVRLRSLNPHEATYYLLVFATFMIGSS